jgi:HEAT repeat protein
LEYQLEAGLGDPYAIPYLMLQYGSTALWPLLKGLKCPSNDMRACCVDCLQKLGDVKAVDPLIQMFDDYDNEPITWEITDAIEQLCKWNNLIPIFNALHSGTTRIKEKIAMLLTDYIDYLDEPVLPELIKALIDSDTGVFESVSAAIGAWAGYHNDRNSASAALAAFLTDNDPERRLFAASALGHAGNIDAAFAIVEAIRSHPEDAHFHKYAFLSLDEISKNYEDQALNKHLEELFNSSYFPGKENFLSLISLSDTDNDKTIDHEISETGESSNAYEANVPDSDKPSLESISILISQLTNPDPRLKIEAAEKLGKLANCEATMDLCSMLYDRNHTVQLAAIKALRKIGDKRAISAFNNLLPQKTCFHREDIAEAMGALGNSAAVPVLASVFESAWLELRAEIVRSLGRIGGNEVIGPLIAALKDNHPKIRRIAVWKLFDLQHKRARKALRQSITHEKNRYVRAEIETALSKYEIARSLS